MKKKKNNGIEMHQTEKMQIIYEAFEGHPHLTNIDLMNLFECHEVKVSKSEVEKYISEISKTIKISKSKKNPAKYSYHLDEYGDLLECIENVKESGDFRSLNYLKTLKRIHENEIYNYTKILLQQLLRFDLRGDKLIHPWAFYILTEECVESLQWILEASPSLEPVLLNELDYEHAKTMAACEEGVEEGIFPKDCPYDLIKIIKKKRHVVFTFRDQFLKWKKK